MDLNLVKVFIAVFETRSLTRAAEQLYLTQPAVSQAVGRLRGEIGDELFLRQGREMMPTAHASEIYPVLRESLSRIEETAVALRAFDPTSTSLRFRIALSELGETTYLSPISAAIRTSAPLAGLDVVALDPQQLAGWLESGAVDAAITSAPDVGAYDQTVLKAEPYVVLMAADHPLSRSGLTVDSYRRAAHAVVTGDTARPALDAALATVGGLERPVVSLNRFAALPLLLTSTDLIATVPLNVGREWLGSWPLAMVDLPLHVDAPTVRLYLRRGGSARGSTLWLRDIILGAVHGLEMPNIGMSPPQGLQASPSALRPGRRSYGQAAVVLKR